MTAIHSEFIIETNERGRQRLLDLWQSGVLDTLLGERVASLEALPLVQRWRDGDEEAGGDLFDKYYDAVQRFFMNKVASGVAALVTWTFQRCKSDKRDVSDDEIQVYLLYLAHQVLREAFHTLGTGPIDFDSMTSQELSPGLSTVSTRDERQRLLYGGLRRIPVTDQTALELHYWHELSMSDIARVLELRHDQVGDVLTRARTRLRDAVDQLLQSPELLGSTTTRLDNYGNRPSHSGSIGMPTP